MDLTPIQVEEVPAFLDYLFSNVAVRTLPLDVRSAASVVRYLQLLSIYGYRRTGEDDRPVMSVVTQRLPADGDSRQLLMSLAETIWGAALIHGDMMPAQSGEVSVYLRDNAWLFKSNPFLAGIEDEVCKFRLADDALERNPYGKTHLRSANMSSSG